jgi:hypothetical protein
MPQEDQRFSGGQNAKQVTVTAISARTQKK